MSLWAGQTLYSRAGLMPNISAVAVDENVEDCHCNKSSVYEVRGKLQIQILCGADDNPRPRINTARQGKRDPCLTSLLLMAHPDE